MRTRAGILRTFSGGFAHRAACKFLILWGLPHFLTVSLHLPPARLSLLDLVLLFPDLAEHLNRGVAADLCYGFILL
jgi:hypothetical protein